MPNHFSEVATQIQEVPRDQRASRLIEGISQQMQQSDNPSTKQLGTELEQAKAQLVRALQQGG